jgi:hypothetical protein
MSTSLEECKAVLGPAYNEFAGMGALFALTKNHQLWAHVFFQLGYEKAEVVEMLTRQGDGDEV